jgi:endoglucanase
MLKYIIPYLFFNAASASNDQTLTPVEMQKLMGLGINLGNRLDLWQQPNRTVQESFFDDFKKAGFANVRIPVCWHNHTLNYAPYTIDAEFLDLVEQIVDWSMARGMVTILNTHHEKWLDLKGWFDRKLPRLEAIWTQIAERFKDKDQKLLFEVFNEPHLMTTEDLNTMNSAILPIIRKTNPTRIVLLMGLKFGNPSWLVSRKSADFKIPSDKQLMMEIHNYDPFKYAGSNPTQTSWGSDEDYAALNEWVSGMKDWAGNRSLPIYYGEFAVTNAQTAATGRDKWYQAHLKVITENGWAASVWNDGGGHLLYNYTSGEWNKDILKDLGKGEAMPVMV